MQSYSGHLCTYVEKTAITFGNMKFPVFKNLRIVSIKPLETYPYLVAEEDGQVLGYAYASTYYARTLIIGQLNCPSICMKMLVVEVWEVSSMMLLKRNLNNGAFAILSLYCCSERG